MYALFVAEGISQVGNTMTVIAGPWFVPQTTGSAAKTGLAGAALALWLLVPILGGPLVDRFGFRRGGIVADLASGATVASIPVLHLAVPRSVDIRRRRVRGSLLFGGVIYVEDEDLTTGLTPEPEITADVGRPL